LIAGDAELDFIVDTLRSGLGEAAERFCRSR
jgi:hypothetical protein